MALLESLRITADGAYHIWYSLIHFPRLHRSHKKKTCKRQVSKNRANKVQRFLQKLETCVSLFTKVIGGHSLCRTENDYSEGFGISTEGQGNSSLHPSSFIFVLCRLFLAKSMDTLSRSDVAQLAQYSHYIQCEYIFCLSYYRGI